MRRKDGNILRNTEVRMVACLFICEQDRNILSRRNMCRDASPHVMLKKSTFPPPFGALLFTTFSDKNHIRASFSGHLPVAKPKTKIRRYSCLTERARLESV